MPRLNYTGRQKIMREDARISLISGSGPYVTFDAELSLAEYDLPADAHVYVEAYRQTSYQRFEFGTVGALTPPDDRQLTEFSSHDGVRFRVKVVNPGTPAGRLLAVADKIRPRQPDEKDENRIPLLPVRSDGDIPYIWKVDFTDDPLLLINRDAGNKDFIALSPEFRSLVFSSVVREIMRKAIDPVPADLDDMEDWRAKWIKFATSLPGVIEPPENGEASEKEDWVDDVVAAFSRKQRDTELFASFWQGRQTS